MARFSSRRFANEEEISKFCDAIRGKPNWPLKILDESRGLSKKWVLEAGLLKNEEQIDDDILLSQAMWDLKAEARRIVELDYSSQILLGSLPADEQYQVDFSTIDQDVSNALKFARLSKYYITQPKLRERVGVFVSDDLVPQSLHSELIRELDRLATKEPRDFHPGSDGKVQDLIHPSLYPYVAGVSPVKPGATLPRLEYGKFGTTMHTQRSYDFESRYAWIPSEFRISDDGLDVHIQSYINGLGPRERHPLLYRLIEKVFMLVLPQLERTREWNYRYEDTPSQIRWLDRAKAREQTTLSDWNKLLEQQLKQKEEEEHEREKQLKHTDKLRKKEISRVSEFHAKDGSVAAVPERYRGKTLKVIVKAANYILRPEQEYEGTWHMEGMPHERIVASAIYYYQCDPDITDKGLSLRRLRDGEIDFPDTETYRHEDFEVNFIRENHTDHVEDSGEGEDEDEDDWEEEGRDVRDYPSDWEDSPFDGQRHPQYTTGLSIYVDLGIVQTTGTGTSSSLSGSSSSQSLRPTGRIVTFPNWIQHKVTGIKNVATKDSAEPALRKILCFFLVDDSPIASEYDSDSLLYHGFSIAGLEGMNVLSSADVPSQARPCNIPSLHCLLSIISQRLTGKALPAELRNYIVELAIEGTVTREVAEKWRRELMDDRRVEGSNNYNQTLDSETFSLCEH